MRAEHRDQPLVVLALAPAQGDEKGVFFFFLKLFFLLERVLSQVKQLQPGMQPCFREGYSCVQLCLNIS